MERVCFVFEIFPGQEAEYDKRHREIWPELVEDLHDAGCENYTIFRSGTNAVGYFEAVPNKRAVSEKLSQSDANERWSRWFETVIRNLTDEEGNLIEMQEVWHLAEL